MHGKIWFQLGLMVLGVLVADLGRSLGRVVLGLAAGLRPSHYVVGVGPVLGRASFAGVGWIWRPVPLRVEPNWRLDASPGLLRRRLWLMTLGGPLSYVGLIAVVRALGVPLTGDAGAMLPAQMIGTMAWVLLLGRLVPIDYGAPMQPAPSDGLQLWRILRAREQDLVDAFAPCVRLELHELLRAGQAPAALALCERSLATFSAPWRPEIARLKTYPLERLGRFGEAKALAATNLAIELPPAARGVTLNDWSWYAFRHRDEDDLRLADARSAEALGLCPKLSSVAGTRGAVLLWRGRVAEAIPLLERSTAGAPGPHGKAVNGYLLAIAYASRGQSARAQELLDVARTHGEDALLRAEAERCVAASVASCRVLFAAHGRRALLVDPDGVELLDDVTGRPTDRDALVGAARSRRRLTLSEIVALRVGRSARGRARLLVVTTGGRVWRLPLAAAELGWARMLSEDVLSPSRPPLPLPTAPRAAPDYPRGVIMGLGFLVTACLMFGFRTFRALELTQFLLVTGLLVVRPAAPAALAFGTTILVGLALAPRAKLVGPGVFDAAAAAAFALVALVAGVIARRRPRLGPDGWGLTLGTLALTLGLVAFVPITLALRGHGGGLPFRPPEVVPTLAAAAVALAWGRRRSGQ